MIAGPEPVTPLMTLGQIAQLLDVPRHRIAYVISSRQIKETARAGRLRVFSLAAVDQIRTELAKIDAKS